MRYAIYSRKSKFTGKGDSIENQIEMCRSYIAANFPEDEDAQIEVFEDEGFSGKNTNRPEFQWMMSEIKKRRFDFLVCYRLDRISRNVGDFSHTLTRLQQHNVSFISIKERFDTSTPMGRAMMNITAVFAELERETIAERIRDNMLMLARSGRWLGGTTPLGFQSVQVKSENIDGKTQTSYKLEALTEEQETVRLIFKKYLETRSLTKTETWCINHDVHTRRGVRFTPVALREILANPVYCTADKPIYDYFLQNGCVVCSDQEEFDGRHGVAAYNRTAHSANGQKKQPMSEWVVAAGKHKGIIASEDWLKARSLLESNRHLSPSYKPQNSSALLSGILVCKNCGSAMRPRVNSNKRRGEDGEQTFAYMCELKRKSKSQQCACPNVNGNQLDKIVCEEILSYRNVDSETGRKLLDLKANLDNGGSEAQKLIDGIGRRISDKEAEISGLISVLAKTDKDGSMFAYTERKVNELDMEIRSLKQERFRLEKELEERIDYNAQVAQIVQALKSFHCTFHLAAVADKREFLRSLIERIEWGGESIHVFLHGEPR